jgi:hypothetical protein
LIKHPGTEKWCDTVKELAASRGNQAWSKTFCQEMKRQLAGCRFLVKNDLGWCMATEEEIFQKSKQRFQGSKKPKTPHGKKGGGTTFTEIISVDASGILDRRKSSKSSRFWMKKLHRVEMSLTQHH